MDDIDVATSNGEFEAQEFAVLIGAPSTCGRTHTHTPEIHRPPRIDSSENCYCNIQKMYICILAGRPSERHGFRKCMCCTCTFFRSTSRHCTKASGEETTIRCGGAGAHGKWSGRKWDAFTNAAGTPSSSNWSPPQDKCITNVEGEFPAMPFHFWRSVVAGLLYWVFRWFS